MTIVDIKNTLFAFIKQSSSSHYNQNQDNLDNMKLLLAQSDSVLPSFLPLIFIFVIFYLLLIRPQAKKQKKLENKKKLVKKGDKIITSGGIQAKVTGFKGDQNEIALIEIAKSVEIEIIRGTIIDVLIDEEEIKKRSAVTLSATKLKKSSKK